MHLRNWVEGFRTRFDGDWVQETIKSMRPRISIRLAFIITSVSYNHCGRSHHREQQSHPHPHASRSSCTTRKHTRKSVSASRRTTTTATRNSAHPALVPQERLRRQRIHALRHDVRREQHVLQERTLDAVVAFRDTVRHGHGQVEDGVVLGPVPAKGLVDGDVVVSARGVGVGTWGSPVADEAGGPSPIDVFDGGGGLEAQDGADEHVVVVGGGGGAVWDGEVVHGRVGGEEDGDAVEQGRRVGWLFGWWPGESAVAGDVDGDLEGVWNSRC